MSGLVGPGVGFPCVPTVPVAYANFGMVVVSFAAASTRLRTAVQCFLVFSYFFVCLLSICRHRTCFRASLSDFSRIALLFFLFPCFKLDWVLKLDRFTH